MAGRAEQVHSITTDETRNVSVDMSRLLDSGELLSGTPDVQCSADLTITNVSRNATSITVNGESVAANMAVQFTVQAPEPGRYRIEVVCGTSGGQVVEGMIALNANQSEF